MRVLGRTAAVRVGIAIMALIALVGCASGPDFQTTGPETDTLVFGYIDSGELRRASLNTFEVRELQPNRDREDFEVEISNEGLYSYIGDPSGTYKTLHVELTQRAGLGLSRARITLNFAINERNVFDVELDRQPGIHYVGAATFEQTVDGGLFLADEYELTDHRDVGERDALLLLQEEVAGTVWESVVAQRLAELN